MNKTIILYGAGNELNNSYRKVRQFVDLDDVIIVCDNNQAKWGKTVKMSDGTYYIIQSAMDVIEKNKNGIIVVTPLFPVRAEIISFLMEIGVPRNRIITFESDEFLTGHSVYYSTWVRQTDNEVVFFAPIEMIFTASLDLVAYHKNNEEYTYLYNQPIVKKKTLLDMYRMFLNGMFHNEAIVPEYNRRKVSVAISGINFDYLENMNQFAEHEYWHFQVMVGQLTNGNLKYFTDIAPFASFNLKQHVFNLHDGTHRAMLFYLMGYRHFPIRVKKSDYECFLNNENIKFVNKAFQICKTKVLDEIPVHAIPVGGFSLEWIYTPILHPNYYNIQVCREYAVQSRLDLLNEFFTFYSFEGRQMLDVGANLAYIPQNFARQGAFITCIEYVKERADLAEALTRLYRLEDKIQIKNCDFFQLDESQRFEIGIILAIFDHWSTKINSDGLNFLMKIDTLIEDMLIWESGNMPAREKELIIANTKFKNYTFVSKTYGTSKYRELGIFTREGYDLTFIKRLKE